ncbi:MAG TPA: hypothetical protein VFM54_14630 [Micromonosporaceae bacterium]|nr:hypothetical protein [Micromonosporaceae bacterium]
MRPRRTAGRTGSCSGRGATPPHTDAGRSLLLHELGHVVEQGWLSSPGPGTARAPAVLRQPAPPGQSPGTYIIVYSSGRVNPRTPVDHNVGQGLVDQIVAKVKQAKGGLLQVIKATQEAYALQARHDQQLRWLNRVLADPRFTVADRAARQSRVDALAKRARAALK